MGFGTGLSDPVKELQIPAEVNRLNALSESLQNSILKLLDRTKRIRFDKPQDPQNAKAVSQAKVPLAEELSSIASRLELQIMVLDETTNSLEI